MDRVSVGCAAKQASRTQVEERCEQHTGLLAGRSLEVKVSPERTPADQRTRSALLNGATEDGTVSRKTRPERAHEDH